jgi:hypothetical protein
MARTMLLAPRESTDQRNASEFHSSARNSYRRAFSFR